MNPLYTTTGSKLELAPRELVLEHAYALLTEHFRTGAPVLEHPDVIQAFLAKKLAGLEREVFAMILLTDQLRLIEYVELFQGTDSFTHVHTREVVKTALKHNAAYVILVHNHPSGVPEPSAGDVEVTRNLKIALRIVDIGIHDHLIIGRTVTSFRDRGIIR